MWVCVRYGSLVLSKQKLANGALCLPLLINARAESGGLIADPLSSNVLDSLRQIGSFFATRNISEYRCTENYECASGGASAARDVRSESRSPRLTWGGFCWATFNACRNRAQRSCWSGQTRASDHATSSASFTRSGSRSSPRRHTTSMFRVGRGVVAFVAQVNVGGTTPALAVGEM
jgi:hypothetical protein